MENKAAILEGILFLAGDEGVDLEAIKLVLDCSNEMAIELINKYKEKLQDVERGLMLVELGNKYKLSTKPEHFEYYQKLVDNPTSFSFSNAALETLAIIAYNQPVTRVEIENIRGVGSDAMVRKLVAKSLIKEVGRKESPGRPMMYAITDEFLDVFNLQSIDELPELKDVELDEEDQNIFNTRFREEEKENSEEDLSN
ncbi:segregation and condensation protein B [Bacilli bacterium PM5-3]|nr:segregation and condensation protein B [Bacilli bacterium PM5-3]